VIVATLSNSNGRRVIQFPAIGGGPRGKRATVRLGKVDAKTAAGVLLHVERLIVAAETQQPPPADTARWLGSIGGKLHGRLAAAGLVTPRTAPAPAPAVAIGPFIDGYLKRRTDLKQWTLRNLGTTRLWLVRFFGEGRDLRSVTRGDAQDFHRHVRAELAGATASGLLKRSRMIFEDAVARELIAANPFRGIKAGGQANPARARYVPAADVERVVAACPSAEWRLVFALARYAGLRTPTEPQALRWVDVDWQRGRMLVHSSKTEHHQGRATRLVPILPALLPHLRDAFERAAEGAEHVIPSLRGRENLRRRALKIVKRAGLDPWPRLFQNLRASCETDLTALVPLHVVCAWIGNTQLIAARHYLQVTDEHFAAVTGGGAGGAAQSAAVNGGLQRTDPEPGAMAAAESAPGTRDGGYSLCRRGLEPSTVSPENQQVVHEALQKALHGPLARRYFQSRGRIRVRVPRRPRVGPKQAEAFALVRSLLSRPTPAAPAGVAS
jgi:integrase